MTLRIMMNNYLYINKNRIYFDIIIVFSIIALPFLFFLYNFIPEDISTYETSFFIIDAGIFATIEAAIWQLSICLFPIFILSIWFLTCKHWWRYLILISICSEVYKLYSKLRDMNNDFGVDFIESVPYILITLFILFFVSKKLGYKSFKKTLNNDINNEIDQLMLNLSRFKSENYKIFKRRYIDLKKEKHNLDKREYLKRLIQLREEFANQ